jgi:hypothetical protein
MKRLVFLMFLLVFVLSACGPMYTIKRDKKGIYRTAELEFNILSTDKGDFGDRVLFNLCKYMYGGNTFYSAKVMYYYPEKGWDFFGMGPGVAGFGILQKNGVMIRVNNGKTFPLKYKKSPEHRIVTTTQSTGGGGYMGAGGVMMNMGGGTTTTREHEEAVECVLTPAQLKYLTDAKSIVLTLNGTMHEREDQTKEKKLEYYFKEDNFKIIKRFFDEEVKGLKTGSGS